MAIAAWLRYLLAVDDKGEAMQVSPDPMTENLQQALAGIRFGEPDSMGENLRPILANTVIFGTDLTKTPLMDKIEKNFRTMLTAGGVRKALQGCPEP